MKRSYKGVIMLCFVLLLNIVCTQYVVNNYFHQKYELVIVFAIENVLLFPIALYIYKKEGKAK